MLIYNHDLDPESVWLLVKSNQIPWGTVPRNAIPYIQEIGHFHAREKFYTERDGLPSYLFKYTVKGGGVLEYQDRIYHVGPGSFFWLDCQKHQKYYTDPSVGHWETVWIHFYGEPCHTYYELFQKNVASPVSKLPDSSDLARTVDDLIVKYSVPGPDSALELRSSGMLTGLMIDAALSNQMGAKDQVPASVTEAIHFLNAHYRENVTIDDISQHLNLSKHYMIRLFKRHTGVTPHEYSINIRLNQAKQLLRSTDLTVAEVAAAVGIDHIGHFINLFKRSEGITPGAYHKYWHG